MPAKSGSSRAAVNVPQRRVGALPTVGLAEKQVREVLYQQSRDTEALPNRRPLRSFGWHTGGVSGWDEIQVETSDMVAVTDWIPASNVSDQNPAVAAPDRVGALQFE